MNRSLIFLMGLGLPLSAAAQDVIQQPTVPEAGFVMDLVAGAFVTPSPASDVAQSWDFSDIGGSTIGLQQVLPAASSSLAPEFDGAEWVNTNGDQLTFWRWDNGGMTILGNANAVNFITIPFDDPLVQWTYPLAYGDVHEDTFACEDTLFALPYTLQGEVSSEVDAFGSIQLPNGTGIDEVLRVQYAQSYTETYDGDTAVWTLTQQMYVAQDSLLPVFFQEYLVVTDVLGDVLLEVDDVAWYDNTIVAVPEAPLSDWKPAYPNPVVAGDEVRWPMRFGQDWQVVDMQGRVLDRGRCDATGEVRLQTTGWTGMVLLMPMSASGQPENGVQRLLVKGC